MGEVAEADGVADDETAAVWFYDTEEHFDEGGLAGAVGSDDAHLLIAGEVIVKIFQNHSFRGTGVILAWWEGLGDVFCLEYLGTDVGAVKL